MKVFEAWAQTPELRERFKIIKKRLKPFRIERRNYAHLE